jgi:hypothetical protein
MEYETEQINKNNNYQNYNNNENIFENIYNDSQKINDYINVNNLNLINKYENLNGSQIKQELTNKNTAIIKLYEEKDLYRNKLNSIISKLNNLISSNEEYLFKKEEDSSLVEQLKKIFDSRKKDCIITKRINNLFKEQYNKISYHFNIEKQNKKLDKIEDKIDDLKIENFELQEKIREFKNKDILTNKNIINMKEEKINLIKAYQDEIKMLKKLKKESKKKINKNKKSLSNIIKEFNNLEELFKQNYHEIKKNENFIINYKFWTKLIKSDLIYLNEEEILENIYEDKSKFLKEIDKKFNKTNNNLIKTKKNRVLPNLTINEDKKIYLRTNSPLEKTHNRLQTISVDNKKDGIFNKYSIFANEKKKLPRYMKSNEDLYRLKGSVLLKQKSIIPPQIKTEESENEKKIEKNKVLKIKNDQKKKKEQIQMLNDFNLTSDSDYRELLHKKEQYVDINSTIKSNINEINKNFNNKYKNLYDIVIKNGKKLKNLKIENELLKEEVQNLYKVLELTKEQNKITQEINKKNHKNKLNLSNTSEAYLLKLLKEKDKKDKISEKNYSLNESSFKKNKKRKINNLKYFLKENNEYVDNYNEENELNRENRLFKIKKKYENYENSDN